jgi:hypothetical protein
MRLIYAWLGFVKAIPRANITTVRKLQRLNMKPTIGNRLSVIKERYWSNFGNGNKGTGDQPNGSIRERLPAPSSEHKTIDKDTLSKLRNCSLAECRPPEFTKGLRSELSGDAIVDSRNRGPAPHSEAQDIILLVFELGSPTSSFLRFTIETPMLTVGDLRRQLACGLKRTKRQLHILFSNAVLREDSKTLKDYGLGKWLGALCIVIESDDMNHPSPLRLFKDFPTLEATDSKKDDGASDLLTSHYPFRHTNVGCLHERRFPHQRSEAAQSLLPRDSLFLGPLLLSPLLLSPFIFLALSVWKSGMQPIPGERPDNGIVGVAQGVDIRRLWEILFCPGEWGASGELELRKGAVCSTCQREIDMFFLTTGLRINR